MVPETAAVMMFSSAVSSMEPETSNESSSGGVLLSSSLLSVKAPARSRTRLSPVAGASLEFVKAKFTKLGSFTVSIIVSVATCMAVVDVCVGVVVSLAAIASV